MTQEIAAPQEAGEVIKYFVNDEEVTHTFEKPPERKRFMLSVRDILESAGFTPVEEYELTRDSDPRPFESLDEEVPIENGERFTATFKGATPVS